MNYRGISRNRIANFIWSLPVLAIVVALMFAGVVSERARAQTQSGLSTIQGTVTDSTKAAIRGATIHIVSKASGVTTDTKSSDVGFYQVPGMVAGAYTITVSAPKMKTNVYNLNLLATQTAVVNPVLTAGEVTEQVTVSADIVQLTDPTSGAITSTLENKQIKNIPMNGRQITTLVGYTTPGLEAGFGGGGVRMNGLVTEAMEYEEDGAPSMDRDFGGYNGVGQAGWNDADSIQEVRVEASGSSAQYGTPATAIITTKSGTNQFHGSMFWTGVNNTVAGVAKGRGNASPYTPANYKRNEFGISAGGPVVIPGLYNGKDKTFWFFAWEKYDLVQSAVQTGSTETDAMKTGDFSGLLTEQLYDPSTTHADAACPTPGVVNGVTIWNAGPPVNNPYCRRPFGNGIMGSPGNNQIGAKPNGLAKIVYDSEIPANLPGVINPRAQANENWNAPIFTFVPTVTWRLDHNFTERDRAYLRYTQNLETFQHYGGALGTQAADGIPAYAFGSLSESPISNFVSAAGYTHVFSPSFFSETIVSGQWLRDTGTNSGNPNANYEQKLGLPNNFGDVGMPVMTGPIQHFNGNQYGYGISDMIFTVNENLTKTLGKHQLLFGGQYRHEKLNYLPDITQEGAAADAGSTQLYNPLTGTSYGGYSNTGDSAADFYMGSLFAVSSNLNETWVHLADQVPALYIQDNYHARRNLTLNLGLRWEAHPAMDTGGVGVGMDLRNHAMVLESPISTYIANGRTTQAIINAYQNAGAIFETTAQAGFPAKMFRSYDAVFDPHLGFSWQPLGTRRGTVLSASYGRYSFAEALRNLLGVARSAPFVQGFTYNNNDPGQDPDGIPNYEIRNPQNIFAGVNTPSSIIPTTGTNFVRPGTFGGGFNPDFPPIFVQEANVTVEQPFKDQSALRVTYNWTHTSNLSHAFSVNGAVSPFVWAYDTGTTPPVGGASAAGTCQFQSTALQPYDCKTYNGFSITNRNGWSVDNSLQVNYQRIFHRGFSYQAMYVWSRPMRFGGNSTRESLAYPYADYPGALGTASGISYAPPQGGSPIATPATPPPPPSGSQEYTNYKALNRFQDYKVEPYFGSLFHHVTINGVWELPLGRGKWLFSNSSRLADELLGGWQIAGVGQVVSQGFAPGASNWGPTSPIKMYKHSVKVNDCTSGKCVSRYMWFNGYISPKLLTPANGGICTANCVTGLPANYVPYETPINNDPTQAANFGTNNVVMTGPNLNGGKPWTVAFQPGPNPSYSGNNLYSRTYLHGPFNYDADLSVTKTFAIEGEMNFRVTLDAFNAFNIMGYQNPNGTTGEESFMPGGVDGGNNYWTPRQLQLTMRFSW